MMLLGWVREVAGWFGGGATAAIWLAVWAIYLIDFSINAGEQCLQAAEHSPGVLLNYLPQSRRRTELSSSMSYRHRSKKLETPGQVGCLGPGRSLASLCE